MRDYLLLLSLVASLVLWSCQNKPSQKPLFEPVHQDTVKKKPEAAEPTEKEELSQADKALAEVGQQKNIHIVFEKDTFSFRRDGFIKIIRDYPELNGKHIFNPDYTFEHRGRMRQDMKDDQFNCEVCRDEYYVLYAYFLMKRNGTKQFKKERCNLIAIYRDINEIFEMLAHGGTGFGHNYTRIYAYVESDISDLKENDADDYGLRRSYNIEAQKRLYINSLRQYARDEVGIDDDIIDKEEKEKRVKEIFVLIDDMGKRITTYFYLSCARSFQYKQYEK